MTGALIVLVVNDDSAIQKTIDEILSDSFTVNSTTSCSQMFSLVQRELIPGIILMKYDISGQNGFEALTMLRTLPGAMDIPMVFILSSRYLMSVELSSQFTEIPSAVVLAVTKKSCPVNSDSPLSRSSAVSSPL